MITYKDSLEQFDIFYLMKWLSWLFKGPIFDNFWGQKSRQNEDFRGWFYGEVDGRRHPIIWQHPSPQYKGVVGRWPKVQSLYNVHVAPCAVGSILLCINLAPFQYWSQFALFQHNFWQFSTQFASFLHFVAIICGYSQTTDLFYLYHGWIRIFAKLPCSAPVG